MGALEKSSSGFGNKYSKASRSAEWTEFSPRRKRLCRRLRKWLRWFRRRRLGYRRFQWRGSGSLCGHGKPRGDSCRSRVLVRRRLAWLPTPLWPRPLLPEPSWRPRRLVWPLLPLPSFLFLSCAFNCSRRASTSCRKESTSSVSGAATGSAAGSSVGSAETASSCHRFQRVGRRSRGRFLRLLPERLGPKNRFAAR